LSACAWNDKAQPSASSVATICKRSLSAPTLKGSRINSPFSTDALLRETAAAAVAIAWAIAAPGTTVSPNMRWSPTQPLIARVSRGTIVNAVPATAEGVPTQDTLVAAGVSACRSAIQNRRRCQG
jgi:hypothetical protein